MKRVVLAGDPVAHSLSPRLYGKWIIDFGLEAEFEARRILPQEFPALLKDLRDGRFHALNATIPHKEALFFAAEEASPAATVLGAANTLYKRDGILFADNTDPEGFIENLKFVAPDWAPRGPALILGTGASARAVVFALIREGQGKFAVCGRNLTRAKTIKRLFPKADITLLSWDERGSLTPSLVVNATPLGLPGYGPLDFSFDGLPPDAVAYDLVYGPEKTRFLKRAEEKGLKAVDGLGMLIFQAIPLFEAWFEKRPSFDQNLLNWLGKGD